MLKYNIFKHSFIVGIATSSLAKKKKMRLQEEMKGRKQLKNEGERRQRCIVHIREVKNFLRED